MAVVALCATCAQAELVGHWSLDEGTGTVAHDGTGNGHDGELIGSPQWIEAYYGMGLEFAGSPDKVDIPYSAQLNPETAFSLSLWANPDSSGSGHRSPITSRDDYPQRGYIIYIEPGNTWQYWLGIGSWNNTQGPAVVFDEWTHVGATYDNGAKKFYINGELVAEGSGVITPNTQQVLRIGGGATEGAGNYFWVGGIDDVAVFDHTLTDAEILKAMKGLAPPELAANPSPEDAVVDVPRDVMLAWEAGEFAAKHDVYFGTTFEDVNTASVANPLDVLVAQGQTDSAYDAGVLAFGQTYFWRVDEVNGAPDNTVFAGNVWSFTVEPTAIPVETITVTASSSNAANMGPENTINGVGLNELDQHSTEGTDMWLSGMGDPTPSIQYEFDKAYKLDEMLVWNSNQLIESFVGLGAKDVVIEHSTDGVEWMTLEGASQFAQATGSPTYTANTVVDFGGALAKFVKITVNAGYGMLPQYGLSEVRFLYIPTFARELEPADGITVDGANVALSWRAGREAVSHEVYLGTDPADLPLVATTSEAAYAASGLNYSTTYYWSITEVNQAEDVTAYAGDVSSFVTPDFGTVDDFDQYDDNCNRIFFAWEDGLGHSGGDDIEGCDVPASNGNGGGSIVGNAQAPFAEKTIVTAGSSQSLPFNYDNAFGPSEARLTLNGQDWTASEVQALSLAFYGTAGNTGTLYVKINNVKVVNDGATSSLVLEGWQIWNIDLSALSGLQNVTSLTIGVDGGSAAGMLYIDDIRLYPSAPAPISEWRVSASSDDGEEHDLDFGTMESLTSSDLEMPYEQSIDDPGHQMVGCRWAGIPIPQGASITEAWVQFSADSVGGAGQDAAVSLIIEGQLSPDPATFTSTALDISARPKTTASVVWDVPEWPTVHAQGPEERTPDISSIIQEIVNQPGWAGQAIVLTFSDNPANPSQGYREPESFDGGGETDAPLLHIVYE